MPYLMLAEDFNILETKIEDREELVQKALKDRSESRGDEDTHDCLGFSHATEKLEMEENQLADLCSYRNLSQLIGEVDTSRVSPGTLVVVQDLRTDEERRFVIGGDRTYNDPDSDGPRRLSRSTPIAVLLMGARPGQRRRGQINGRPHGYEVLSIGSALAIGMAAAA